MISHLSYRISHNTKVGYANLISVILKKNKIKLPSNTSFDLETNTTWRKDTLSRFSLKVLDGKLVFKGAETKGKGEVGSKRKLEEEVSIAGNRYVRKSQRIAETKTPRD